MRVAKSATKFPLIFWSRGESQPRDGLRLTSISQVYSRSSIMISNPRSSKQLEENGTYYSNAVLIWTSAEMMVFSVIFSTERAS